MNPNSREDSDVDLSRSTYKGKDQKIKSYIDELMKGSRNLKPSKKSPNANSQASQANNPTPAPRQISKQQESSHFSPTHDSATDGTFSIRISDQNYPPLHQNSNTISDPSYYYSEFDSNHQNMANTSDLKYRQYSDDYIQENYDRQNHAETREV